MPAYSLHAPVPSVKSTRLPAPKASRAVANTALPLDHADEQHGAHDHQQASTSSTVRPMSRACHRTAHQSMRRLAGAQPRGFLHAREAQAKAATLTRNDATPFTNISTQLAIVKPQVSPISAARLMAGACHGRRHRVGPTTCPRRTGLQRSMASAGAVAGTGLAEGAARSAWRDVARRRDAGQALRLAACRRGWVMCLRPSAWDTTILLRPWVSSWSSSAGR